MMTAAESILAHEPRTRRLTRRRLVLFLIVGAAALATTAILVVPRLLGPKNWGVVEPGGLYRSGLIAPRQVRRTLADHKVQVVVTFLAEEAGDPRQKALLDAAASLNIELLRFPMPGDGIPKEDGLGSYTAAVAAVARARQAGKVVLVQCSAGAQRTGGVVACYETLVLRRDPAEVVRHMIEHKWRPDKEADLLAFVNSILPELAGRLKEMGVLQQVPQPIPVLRAP